MYLHELKPQDWVRLHRYHRAFQAAVEIEANHYFGLEITQPMGIDIPGGGVLVHGHQIRVQAATVDDALAELSHEASAEELATGLAMVAIAEKSRACSDLIFVGQKLPLNRPLTGLFRLETAWP